MSKKGVVVAKNSGMVVGRVKNSLLDRRRVKIYGLCALLVLALVGLGVGVNAAYTYKKHTDTVRKTNAVKQQKLQKSISSVDAAGNVQKLKADSDALIKGANNGTYDVSNEQLAVAYASRADTELYAKDYKAAIADYQKAAQLASSQKTAAQYGEFIARYRLGERKALIPLLQALEQPLKNSQEPQSQQQLGLYEQYIADLQAGKDLEL